VAREGFSTPEKTALSAIPRPLGLITACCLPLYYERVVCTLRKWGRSFKGWPGRFSLTRNDYAAKGPLRPFDVLSSFFSARDQKWAVVLRPSLQLLHLMHVKLAGLCLILTAWGDRRAFPPIHPHFYTFKNPVFGGCLQLHVKGGWQDLKYQILNAAI
jgi:hypothetical protein